MNICSYNVTAGEQMKDIVSYQHFADSFINSPN